MKIEVLNIGSKIVLYVKGLTAFLLTCFQKQVFPGCPILQAYPWFTFVDKEKTKKLLLDTKLANLLNGSDVTRSKTSSSSSLKLSLQETRVEKDEAGARPGLGLPLPANR